MSKPREVKLTRSTSTTCSRCGKVATTYQHPKDQPDLAACLDCFNTPPSDWWGTTEDKTKYTG